MAAAEHKSYIELTKDTPYLALTGELYEVSVVRVWEEIDRVIMAPHCIVIYGVSGLVFRSVRTAVNFEGDCQLEYV